METAELKRLFASKKTVSRKERDANQADMIAWYLLTDTVSSLFYPFYWLKDIEGKNLIESGVVNALHERIGNKCVPMRSFFLYG